MELHNDAKVTRFGYIGLGVQDIHAWKDFAANVLGLMLAGESSDGATLLRMDEMSRRFMVYPSGEDDVIFYGYEVQGKAQLDALEAKLKANGVETARASGAEKKSRAVVDMIHCQDPSGMRIEIFYGPKVEYEKPFKSERAISGFVTGEQGLGHTVLSAPDIKASRHFYEDILGFLISDYISMEVAPNFSLDLVFMHCNLRHHTLALAPIKTKKRLFHFMLQLNNLDDIGATYDLVKARDIKLGMELGKHTNDHMVSFYMKTPSGFEVEYGWGARTIDDATWSVTQHTSGSMWGHKHPL